MSFSPMNAKSSNGIIMGKPLGTGSSTVSVSTELATSSFGLSLFEVPAVVDVSGMEFGMSVAIAAGSVVPNNTTIASGASTVALVFADLGATGTQLATTNHLTNEDDFSNTVTGGWTTGLMRTAVGTSTTDLDADDDVGVQIIANLTTAGGIGAAYVSVNYIFGKPGAIN